MSEELTSDTSIDEAEIQAILDHETLIMQTAHEDIVRYPPVTLFSPAQTTRMLRDYSGFLERSMKLSREEVEEMIRTDLKHTLLRLRAKLLSFPDIGPVRCAVLLHVALFLGVEALVCMTELFDALHKKDYEGAYRALMLSSWPALVGITQVDRIRVLNLAEQLRTGVTSHAKFDG